MRGRESCSCWPAVRSGAKSASGHAIDFSREPLSDLGAPARQAVEGAAAILPCACGCGHRIDECLAGHQGCAHAKRSLSLIAALARAGASAGEIALEVQQHQRTFEEPAKPIDLSQAACKGPADATVSVVLFSDFECPACASAAPLLDGLARPDGDVRLCFKYFPLDSHAHSRLTAQAAEFAREHGLFWELHNKLFEHQQSLALDDVVRLGGEVGLDPSALRQTLSEDRFLDRVNGSKAQGKAIGVTGTPTVFFNGRLFTLPLDSPFLALAVEDHRDFARGGFTRD